MANLKKPTPKKPTLKKPTLYHRWLPYNVLVALITINVLLYFLIFEEAPYCMGKAFRNENVITVFCEGNKCACYVNRSLTNSALQSPPHGLVVPSELFNFSSTANNPSVCVIVRTYRKQARKIPAFVSSLLANRYGNIRLFLTNTDPSPMNLVSIANFFNHLVGHHFVHVTDITVADKEKLYTKLVENDFGYVQTDMALEMVLSSDITCDYVMFTNGDNLYSANLFESVIEDMRKGTELIGFEFTSHYCYDANLTYVSRTGCDTQFFTEFQANKIDLGAAMFSREVIVRTNERFLIDNLASNPRGTHVRMFGLDGQFIHRIKAKSKSSNIIRKVLLVHQ